MKQKWFFVALAALLLVCVGLTLAHVLYIVFAYQHSSIIYFISKELW